MSATAARTALAVSKLTAVKEALESETVHTSTITSVMGLRSALADAVLEIPGVDSPALTHAREARDLSHGITTETHAASSLYDDIDFHVEMALEHLGVTEEVPF